MTDLDLLVLGDANPDLVLTGDVEPAFGQAERLVDEARLVVGGSGAITACGAARLGLRTAFVGVVGDDVFGRFMLDALAERGVDVSACVVDPERPTGISALLRRTRHVHVSSYFLQPLLAPDLPELFEVAHAAGATTSIDPNRAGAGDVRPRGTVR